MSYLRFDIPSTITDNHKIKLNIVVDGDSTLNGGFSIQEYRQIGWRKAKNIKFGEKKGPLTSGLSRGSSFFSSKWK